MASCYNHDFLSEKQVKRILDAVQAASELGCPLTESVTVHLRQAKLGRYFVRRFFKLDGDWSSYRIGKPAAFVWVLESPPINEKGQGGLHLHALVHLPLELREDFRDAARGWIKLAGGELKAGVFHSRRVDGADSGHKTYYLAQVGKAARYFLKGADPAFAESYGIDPKYQGDIVGKRLGISQSLSPHKREKLPNNGR